jgi:hypothetical protein
MTMLQVIVNNSTTIAKLSDFRAHCGPEFLPFPFPQNANIVSIKIAFFPVIKTVKGTLFCKTNQR